MSRYLPRGAVSVERKLLFSECENSSVDLLPFHRKASEKREQRRGSRIELQSRPSERNRVSRARDLRGRTDRRADVAILPSIDQSNAVDVGERTNAFPLCLGVFLSLHFNFRWNRIRGHGRSRKKCKTLSRPRVCTFSRIWCAQGGVLA